MKINPSLDLSNFMFDSVRILSLHSSLSVNYLKQRELQFYVEFFNVKLLFATELNDK